MHGGINWRHSLRKLCPNPSELSSQSDLENAEAKRSEEIPYDKVVQILYDLESEPENEYFEADPGTIEVENLEKTEVENEEHSSLQGKSKLLVSRVTFNSHLPKPLQLAPRLQILPK